MIRRVVAEFVAALLGVGLAFVIAAQPAVATTPPCQVTGHLEASPGHVSAVFTVAETCSEVSLLSWLAPDAHAGQPQTLYDRHSESDVAPGDYRWSITAPPEGCFVQVDLRVPGHNVDALLGGDHVCQPPPTATTSVSITTTTTPPSTPTTMGSASTTVSASAATSSSMPLVNPTDASSSSSDQLAFSGGGELWALTLGALGLIGAGRWVELRGRRRRAGQ